MYEGTPPVVYVFGMYCKMRDRGVEREISMAARKNPK
jgi:hypothetical protein